jgi:selenide,water dikinase
VLINGARKDLLDPGVFSRALESMAALNDAAARLAIEHGAHACTDITGFGLAGHGLEMARASRAGLRLRNQRVPVHEGSLEMIMAGVTTAMTSSNRTLSSDQLRFPDDLDEARRALYFDPQTSGGLLIALPPERADDLVGALRNAGSPSATRIGEVGAPGKPFIDIL